MRLGSLLVIWLLVTMSVEAIPRAFAPAYLKAGSVNEVYLWDEVVVGPFLVEVVRPDASKPLVSGHGLAVDRPLSVLSAANRPLKWSAAFVAVDAFEAPGPVTVRFLTPSRKLIAEVSSAILPRLFPVETITLDQTMSDLRSKPSARKDREAAEIWKVYLTYDPKFAWNLGRFRLPVPPSSLTSAHFGDERHYLYSDQTTSRDYHRGTDFAVPVGTPVSAPAPGVVSLARDRLLTGLTVVLEHAPGVYSVYFHLSQLSVKKNQKLAAGDPVGLSGATGLVTGPHLHWEVRVEGVPVDPLDLVGDGLLDTNLISAVISSIERPIH